MDSLANHVRHLLQHAYDNPSDHQATESYQSTFEGEGVRKTEFIVEELQRCERDGLFKIENCVAVSVGGADGSDLDALLSHTAINTAFLIEYSDDGAQAARDRAAAWRSKGKSLSVLQGDATMRKQDLINALRLLVPQGYTTLVLTFLAVLHELPRRSTEKYDLRSYLGTLSDVFPNNSIFISEPCTPLNWPKLVEIKIADLDTELLYRWSLYIKRSLWDNEQHPDPVQVGSGYVRMSRELAMETLFKTIRRHDVSRHLYEIGERLSSFNPELAVRAVRDALVDARVLKIVGSSSGFLKAYGESGVAVRTLDSVPCDPPDSHIKLIAHSVRRQLKSANTTSSVAVQKDHSGQNAKAKADASLPLLKIKSDYSLGLNNQQKIIFFREALRRLAAGSSTLFAIELADIAALEKQKARLDEMDRHSDAQKLKRLKVVENLEILELRRSHFYSTLDAYLRDQFRVPLSNFGTEDFYIEVANIFGRAIKLIWSGPEASKDDCCDVIVHTNAYKDGPYTTLKLSKAELAAADIREAGTDLLRGPPEDYEGRIRNFSSEARTHLLYPAVIYIFLRDGFVQPLLGEYQSLDRWFVSKA